MSNTDSFIDEVSEDLRREKLYKAVKSYGWIAVVCVLLIVAGTAYNEYSKAQQQQQAQAAGDQLLNALDASSPNDQLEALQALNISGQASMLNSFLTATAQIETEKPLDAIEALTSLADDPNLDTTYQNIAQFKSYTLQVQTINSDDELKTLLQKLETFGINHANMRLLALEQMALIELKLNNKALAIEHLNAILEDAEVSARMTSRSEQLLAALGAPSNTP